MKDKTKSPYGSKIDNWLADELSDREFTTLYEAELSKFNLGERLKQVAQDRGLSVRRLASRMKTSISQVQRLFGKEAVKCQLDTLIKFSIASGCSLSDIVGISKPRSIKR